MTDNELAYYKGPADPVHATPQDFFDKLNDVYRFTLDPCANEQNHKCETWFGPGSPYALDGLAESWAGHKVFMNPPYGREIVKWVRKAYQEHKQHGILIIGLLPSRTGPKWFHNWVYHKAELIFLEGRLKFGDGEGSAPFDSLLAKWG